MINLWSLFAMPIPIMVFLGLRHGLDVDHISAVDSLVRMHNASKKARWVGFSFSSGHMLSVLLEMLLVVYTVGDFLKTDTFSLWSGLLGAGALALIGIVNIYAMKKYGKTGASILAGKILSRTGMLGPHMSAFVVGTVFGLGFDTTTQIAAISLSAVTSATEGVQTSLMLVGFFGVGMISMDTLNSVLLRSAFWRIFQTKTFRYMAYALSAVALTVATAAIIETITNTEIIPSWAGPALAVSVVSSSFAYAFWKKREHMAMQKTQNKESS